MNKRIVMLSLLAFSVAVVSCKKKGCTDEKATNYSEKAKKDDGSCEYDEDIVTLVITDDINTPTVIEDQTVKISNDISVNSNLTIDAGAIIIMEAGASITIEETGYISAIGTASNPIVIKGETETAAFWEGIGIKSNNPNNKLIHCTVKDAGGYWGWGEAAVFLGDGAKLEMNNSTISNSVNVGLYAEDGSTLPNFSNNTFSQSTTGLNISVTHIKDLDANSNYNSSNTNDFIYVRAGDITTDATWPATTTPYLIHDVDVKAGLTLSPGATFLMEAGAEFYVHSTGFLNAVGTAANPIEIKGRYTSAGYWEGIRISSNNPNNKFAYTQIADGGAYWGFEYSNIYLLDGALEIDNCTVSNGNSWGMFISSSSTVKTSGSIQTESSGVEANNTFSGNGAGGDADCTGGCGVHFD
jgi:hypothetical protein